MPPSPPLTQSSVPLQVSGGATVGKAGAALVELCSKSSGTEAPPFPPKNRAKLTSQVSTTTPLLSSHVPPGGQGWKQQGKRSPGEETEKRVLKCRHSACLGTSAHQCHSTDEMSTNGLVRGAALGTVHCGTGCLPRPPTRFPAGHDQEQSHLLSQECGAPPGPAILCPQKPLCFEQLLSALPIPRRVFRCTFNIRSSKCPRK